MRVPIQAFVAPWISALLFIFIFGFVVGGALDAATGEVSAVMDQIRREELAREAIPLAMIRRDLGLQTDATLSDVIGAAPDPWGEIFREHQAVLLSYLGEVEMAAASNRELLQRGLRSTQEFLASLNATPVASPASRIGL